MRAGINQAGLGLGRRRSAARDRDVSPVELRPSATRSLRGLPVVLAVGVRPKAASSSERRPAAQTNSPGIFASILPVRSLCTAMLHPKYDVVNDSAL
jgi:hypothetical protein